MLRLGRESRGVPLEEVARETRIRVEYLEAIESGNWAVLPGDVYARGFLRNYATYLGLDPAAVIAAYEGRTETAKRRPRPANAPVTTAPPPAPRRPEPIRIQPLSPTPVNTRVRYAPNLRLVSLIAFVVVLVGVLGANLLTGVQRAQTPLATPTVAGRLAPPTWTLSLPTAAAAGTVATPPPVATPGGSADPTQAAVAVMTAMAPPSQPTQPGKPAPTPVAGGPLLPSPTAAALGPGTGLINTPTVPAMTPGAGVSVQLTVQSQTQNAWVLVTLDGKIAFQGVLAAGSSRQWQAQNTVRVKFARGDITAVNVNGVDKGTATDTFQTIITKEWDATGNERVIQ
jgi:cytoskeletal protein RodZ